MPRLLWKRAKDGAQIPANALVQDGLMVIMEGRGYRDTLPEAFRVLRGYSPLLKGFMHMSFRARWKHIEGDEWLAYPEETGVARTQPSPLASPGFFGTQRWRFSDGDGSGASTSPTVRTNRWAGLRFRPSLATPPGTPVDAKLVVEATVPTGLQDPTLTLDLVFPWESKMAQTPRVQDLLADELGVMDPQNRGPLYERLLQSIAEFLPYEPLDGWSFGISSPEIQLEPGETGYAEIDIDTGSLPPGVRGLALAVQATDPRDEASRTVSEVILVEPDPESGRTLISYIEA